MVTMDDYKSNPFSIPPSDNPSLALLGKNKFGFVNGSIDMGEILQARDEDKDNKAKEEIYKVRKLLRKINNSFHVTNALLF